MEHNGYYKYIGDEVIVKHSDKLGYIKAGLLGMHGIIRKISGTSIGVEIDGIKNSSSSTGVFWFNLNELKRIGKRSKEMLKGYDNVAYVQHEKWGKYMHSQYMTKKSKSLKSIIVSL